MKTTKCDKCGEVVEFLKSAHVTVPEIWLETLESHDGCVDLCISCTFQALAETVIAQLLAQRAGKQLLN